jgi:hypothetical protein
MHVGECSVTENCPVCQWVTRGESLTTHYSYLASGWPALLNFNQVLDLSPAVFYVRNDDLPCISASFVVGAGG